MFSWTRGLKYPDAFYDDDLFKQGQWQTRSVLTRLIQVGTSASTSTTISSIIRTNIGLLFIRD